MSTTHLRVTIVVQYYRPHRTGLTLHAAHLAEALVARGHSVTVVAARHDRTCARVGTERGVAVHRLWAPIRISRGMIAPFHAIATWRALKHCDVVHVHTPMLETALVGIIARLRRVPMVITHHGDLVLPPGRFSQFVQRFVGATHRVGLRLAKETVVYSDDYRRVSTYVDNERPTIVIAPPVEIPAPSPTAATLVRQQLVPEGGPLLLFAGRFVREKRPDVAIEALALVRKTHPAARLAFAGQYEFAYENTWVEHADLVRTHAAALSFLGLVEDRQHLADLYAASDVLVLTSDTECFGLVQAEAMLCGTPVVMTDVAGGRVPVQATGMGRLAEPGDPHSVARAICEVLAHHDELVIPPADVRRRLGLDDSYAAYEDVLRAAAR